MPGIKSLSRQQKWSLFDDHVQHDRRPTSKIDLRARSICVWFCISRHEDMAALQPSSDVSMMTVISLCVILHLKRHACVIISMQYNFLYDLPTHLQAWRRTSWRGLANLCLFWCNLCVWFCISKDMLVWLSLCSTIFCMIYLLTCKAWRTSRRGLTNLCLFWCNMFLISHILPITKATRIRYSSSLACNKGDVGSLIVVCCP
jgi:hypothetical protein